MCRPGRVRVILSRGMSHPGRLRRHPGMRIAIAGGTGTLGGHVATELRSRGHEVRVLSRSAPEYRVDLVTGAGLGTALEGCDVLVDASNNAGRKAATVLVDGTRRLLAAGPGARQAGARVTGRARDQGAEELARAFQAQRPRLVRLAYATTGSLAEAEDCVQEAWLRLRRVPDPGSIRDLGAWLTTTVSRLALDAVGSSSRPGPANCAPRGRRGSGRPGDPGERRPEPAGLAER